MLLGCCWINKMHSYHPRCAEQRPLLVTKPCRWCCRLLKEQSSGNTRLGSQQGCTAAACTGLSAQLYLLNQRWLQKPHALLWAAGFSCEVNLGLYRIWHFITPRNAPAFPKVLTEILAWTCTASSSLDFVSLAPGAGNHCGISRICTAFVWMQSHTLTLRTASDSWDKLWLFPKKGIWKEGSSSFHLSWAEIFMLVWKMN